MTDKEKLDAIRAEIHKLVHVNGYSKEMADELFAFINSLPEDPVSEDLEEAAKQNQIKYVFDNNVKEIILAELKYIGVSNFKDGANWQKEQMMKDASVRSVHIGEDSCPFIRRYELAYDIKKQIPDIKEGDKVRVIIIKENT